MKITKVKFYQKVSKRRLDPVWYGGDILSITFDKRYVFIVSAVGDIGIKINGEYYKDHRNGGFMKQYLFENGIKTDKQLKKNQDKIIWYNNNWFEFSLWDTVDQIYLDNGFDTVLDELILDDFDWARNIVIELLYELKK